MELTKEQIAKRLVYLWHIRETDIKSYIGNGLGDEKEEIYYYYGADNEIASLADKYFYNTHREDFERVIQEGSKYKFE